MAVDLDSFAREVDANDPRWASMGLAWSFAPVHPNHGKAIISASFEAPPWAGELTVWITGEAELATLRVSDGWAVSKHYDFAAPEDVQVALGELSSLVSDGTIPHGAVSTQTESRP